MGSRCERSDSVVKGGINKVQPTLIASYCTTQLFSISLRSFIFVFTVYSCRFLFVLLSSFISWVISLPHTLFLSSLRLAWSLHSFVFFSLKLLHSFFFSFFLHTLTTSSLVTFILYFLASSFLILNCILSPFSSFPFYTPVPLADLTWPREDSR